MERVQFQKKENSVNDSEYEAVYESFMKKHKSYFLSFSDTDLKQFIVIFEESLRKHIKNSTKNKDGNLHEKTDKRIYILYVLLRLTIVDFTFSE